MKKSFYAMLVFTSLFFAGVVYAAGPGFRSPVPAQNVQPNQAQWGATQAPQGTQGALTVRRGMMGGSNGMMGRAFTGGNVQYGNGQQVGYPQRSLQASSRERSGGVGMVIACGFTMLLVWIFLILAIKMMWHKMKKCKMGGCCGHDMKSDAKPEVQQ